MVRHPPDDCVSQFTWLCDRAETLDAFNSEHKRRLGMWKSQLCRAGFNTTSVQRNNFNASHNRNGNKSNYYGSTSKFQNNHQSINCNTYNHKSSSYPNMHTKQQANQAGSTRTSLNNLCPPPTASPLSSVCTISTNTSNPHQTPSPSSTTSSISPSSILSNCSSLLKAAVVTTVPIPTTTQPQQQVRFCNTTNGGGSTTTNGVTKSQATSEQQQQNNRTDNNNRNNKSVDIESSLENLCLQMMEHALGP